MFGLKDIHIKVIQSVFSNYSNVEEAVLYGSRAKGNWRTGSDIDLTLVGEGLSLSMLLKIENEIDDLLLPYKINLSILDRIEDPDLIEHINRVGAVFYKKEQISYSPQSD